MWGAGDNWRSFVLGIIWIIKITDDTLCVLIVALPRVNDLRHDKTIYIGLI